MTPTNNLAGMRSAWVITLAAAAILMVTMGTWQSLSAVRPPHRRRGADLTWPVLTGILALGRNARA
jgi:hypothetical protein